MSQFPNNKISDEYVYPPTKKNINSFHTDTTYSCMSPYGPVSNINCPKNQPYCGCPSKTVKLQPNEIEPTDVFLAELKNQTSECFLIKENLSEDWIGIDYGNPHADYSCTNCSGISGGSGFTSVQKVSEDWQESFTDDEDPDNTEKKYYYNYDKRKMFGEGGITTAFPSPLTEINETSVDCGQDLIGSYFKYYKEYSKTASTFWNTPPKTPLYRRAQTALMGTQKIKILVHGNLAVRPGKMVYVDYYNFGGRWMVYKVQRIITAQKHSMYLYLMRDGVA
jgi:hypothetical protein